ncbi:hypothetical protein [Actinoallomurus iriomotensis]|uniref:Uncharacterized protein n=1 Tax=Actinoallomurus iriomotensis TaxID=478107 RepID=A0A9W6RZY7_9ACTN|nr:hypothetical protein [Actinoallomurus iriomotensis]GLY85931.1 hypothetical protein Airi02_038600 [Actinoallomurus iriomotensis]
MTGKTTPQQRRARWLAPVIVWGSLSVGGLIVLAPPLWTYALGEPTVARVESCETSVHVDQHGNGHDETTCHGSWTAGGARRSGTIDGAHRGLVHQDVRVRARGDSAATTNTVGRSLAACGIAAVIGVVAHIACYRALAGGARR